MAQYATIMSEYARICLNALQYASVRVLNKLHHLICWQGFEYASDIECARVLNMLCNIVIMILLLLQLMLLYYNSCLLDFYIQALRN